MGVATVADVRRTLTREPVKDTQRDQVKISPTHWTAVLPIVAFRVIVGGTCMGQDADAPSLSHSAGLNSHRRHLQPVDR
jgi:hypothetical protein